MWFCKLQSVLHVQHENKVLNPGLSVQRIATDFEICLYGLQNHRVGSKNPEFHGILLSHSFSPSLSLYTARPSFEYYRQVYFVHSGLQDESLQVTISKLP